LSEKKLNKPNTKKKVRKVSPMGRAHIVAGFNNTIITITDAKGDVVCWGSAGTSGFKGTKKSTPFAATISSEGVGKKAYGLGVREVAVVVKGPGTGRNSAVKSLKSAGLRITSITDLTPIPHNGCRPKKRRRV